MTETFATTELGLASMLYAKGVKFYGLRQTASWRFEMVFEAPEEQLLREWQAGSVEGNLLAYFRAGTTLKHSLKTQEPIAVV